MEVKLENHQCVKMNPPKSKEYKCFYCNKYIGLKELREVDQILSSFDPEDHEFILDALPPINKPRTSPHLHMSNLGYEVLNMCRECFDKAERKSKY